VHDYNAQARAYWWALAAAGYSLLVFSVVRVASLPDASIYQILLAIGFVGAVAIFPVRIPRTKLSVAGGEIFIFLALLQFGIEAAAIAAAAEGAIGASRVSKRWTSWFGAPAMASITVWASGTAFVLARGAVPSSGTFGGADILLLTGFAVLYCLLSNLLPSALLAFKNSRRLNLVALVADNSWMFVAHIMSAAIAAAMYYAGAAFGIWVAFAAAPTIVLSMSSAHYLFERANSERQAQAALLEAAKQESDRAKAHAAELERSQARFHGAFTNAAIGMALVSVDGQIRQVNPAVCALLGYAEAELCTMKLADLMPAGDYAQLQADINRIAAGSGHTTQHELCCLDRRGNTINISLTTAYFGDGTHDPDLIVQMQDIRERKSAEAKLVKMAFHDVLTGLPNRIYFREQLTKALTRFKRHANERFALMFLDFDHFKSVNDKLGHAAGDQLLIAFADRIRAVLRATDTVARLGGDEFAVLVEDDVSDERVIELAQRIQDSIRQPYVIEGAHIVSSASIGIAFSHARHNGPDEVVRDADTAMYQAKSEGKARHAVFDPARESFAFTDLPQERVSQR
jgi:diguanylate cyclase (GGDEF)-like protein/PAS domain S-box-containing protein